MTKVEGDEAAQYYVVRLDSLMTINDGPLLAADEHTGFVKWKDRSGTEKEATLGERAIRIMMGRK